MDSEAGRISPLTPSSCSLFKTLDRLAETTEQGALPHLNVTRCAAGAVSRFSSVTEQRALPHLNVTRCAAGAVSRFLSVWSIVWMMFLQLLMVLHRKYT